MTALISTCRNVRFLGWSVRFWRELASGVWGVDVGACANKTLAVEKWRSYCMFCVLCVVVCDVCAGLWCVYVLCAGL